MLTETFLIRCSQRTVSPVNGKRGNKPQALSLGMSLMLKLILVAGLPALSRSSSNLAICLVGRLTFGAENNPLIRGQKGSSLASSASIPPYAKHRTRCCLLIVDSRLRKGGLDPSGAD